MLMRTRVLFSTIRNMRRCHVQLAINWRTKMNLSARLKKSVPCATRLAIVQTLMLGVPYVIPVRITLSAACRGQLMPTSSFPTSLT